MLLRNPVQIKTLFAAGLTLGILAFVPTTLFQTLAFLVVWGLLLAPLALREFILFVVANINFLMLNNIAQHNGLFAFVNPDALGLPYWEFLMWGAFVVMLRRLLPHDTSFSLKLFLVSLPMPMLFSVITDQMMLSIAATALCGILIFMIGQKCLIPTLFCLVYGTCFEMIGVETGQWSYPQPAPIIGFPWWGFAMWVSTGIIALFVAYPLIDRILTYVQKGSPSRST